MVKRNKLIALLMVFIMIVSITGCGESADSVKSDTNNESALTETISTPSATNDTETQEDSSDVEHDSWDAETAENDISLQTDNADFLSGTTEEGPLDNIVDNYEEEDINGLSSTQRNSINLLNYMTVLTQEINESKGNQLFLESAYSSLVNDIYPNSVDTKTQAQITSLMDTVDEYRMIAVKRDRILYIYEQNQAQALRQAIPNPVGLLSAVQSGSL